MLFFTGEALEEEDEEDEYDDEDDEDEDEDEEDEKEGGGKTGAPPNRPRKTPQHKGQNLGHSEIATHQLESLSFVEIAKLSRVSTNKN